MTKNKTKIVFIENYRARKTTYEKREKELLKKIQELSTLCGIHACAIIFNPFDAEPVVWPSTLGVQHVIAKFERLPKIEQMKKMLNQETFLKQRIVQLNEKLRKQRIKNREKEIMELMCQCLANGKGVLQNLMSLDLNDLGLMIEKKLEEINKGIEAIHNMAAVEQVAQPALPQPQIPAVTHQMQPTGMEVEVESRMPQLYGEFINCPIQNMGFAQGRDGQNLMLFGSNSTTN